MPRKEFNCSRNGKRKLTKLSLQVHTSNHYTETLILILPHLTEQGKLDELKQKRNESRQLQLANSKLMTANPASTANAVLLNQLEADKSQLKEIIQENVKVLLTVVFPIVCEGLPNG